MTSTALTLYQPRTLQEIVSVGEILARSGYFKDAQGAAQAVAKIMAGQELGITALAALTGIYFFDGRITVGANIMAQLVKRSPKYDYRVVEMSEKRCEVAFYEIVNGERQEIGRSAFSMEDARRAGLTNKANWQRYPQNMLFSRALSNGVRWFCPDVSMSGPLYTPDEFGVPVDEDGNVIGGALAESVLSPKPAAPEAPLPSDGGASPDGQDAQPARRPEAITPAEAKSIGDYGRQVYGMSNSEILEALGVSRMRDFDQVGDDGTHVSAAIALIDDWYGRQQASDTAVSEPDATTEPPVTPEQPPLLDVPEGAPDYYSEGA